MSYPMGPTNLDAFSSIISGNRRPKGEITIEARAAIIAAVQAGDKKRLVAKRFGISPAAVNRTLQRFEKTGQLASRPRSGRPRTKLRNHDPFGPKTGPQPVEGLGFRHVGDPQTGVEAAGSEPQTRVHVTGSGVPGPVTQLTSFVVDRSETRPSTLLSSLTATLHPTTYVFASLRDPSTLPPMPQIQPFFQEPEGITIVTSLGYARMHRMECFFPCRMITLNFTSSAEAAGHTAVLVARLAARNLGVKPVSGFYHDHLLVPVGRETEAMDILAAVAEENRGKPAAEQATTPQAVEDRPEKDQPTVQDEGDDAQRHKDLPEADQPEADQHEAQETEEEEPEDYGDGYDSKAHQCSEVDDLPDDDSPDGDTPEEDPAKE
ncbi:hypothetical protein TOPH_06350 [Tolypocladium ophioglossoides CBS 100239]|uniref:DUF2241 domain-containing protein n=1 Tax=Tolypocladium ophioglossoides (strain CBS 100239) TaxID=1163406 RepID=A0A0L0N5H0_TOLOC|nr:hypothetical protein TOPH_06350 [Tolypocladium ophioglossoides CBS 100239]